MKNSEMLRKIYFLNKEINRNVSRVINLILMLFMCLAKKEADKKGDEKGKKIAKLGLIFTTVVNVFFVVADGVDIIKEICYEKKLKTEEDEIQEIED